MRRTSLKTFALTVAFGVGCSATPVPEEDSTGGSSGSGGTTGGSTVTAGTGGSAIAGAGTGGGATGGNSTGGNATGGSTTGGAGAGGSVTGGAPTGGNGTGGFATGGFMNGGGGSGGNATGGMGTGGMSGTTSTGGNATGGNATGGNATGGGAGAGSGGGNVGGAGTGGASGGAGGSGGSGGTVSPTDPPDCNAMMPSGPQQHSGNGTGGEGNLAWEIWSNTGQGQLTTYSTPAFIATWNNAGGYLGRLGYEWGRFGDTPVPHTQRGTITAQFVSRKSGSGGGYSYIGMYGWTTNPCVEWYVIDDTFGSLPFNPGGTTDKGDKTIDGGTYDIYTRATTGTGGTRCSGVNNWIQYYSIRKTARACGVISLTEHFNIWESLGMDMSGELLEAKILVEVGGGVGNVELPVANVVVQ